MRAELHLSPDIQSPPQRLQLLSRRRMTGHRYLIGLGIGRRIVVSPIVFAGRPPEPPDAATSKADPYQMSTRRWRIPHYSGLFETAGGRPCNPSCEVKRRGPELFAGHAK